ncbi:MAG: thioredoxin [Firmicutes bacterium]|nr:thioredoxin [Bacillota bacterium]
MAEVEVTDANFRQVVLEAKGPVMVDFWAAWCGPCRMLAPIVEQIAEEYEGKLTVAKLNVDENPQTAAAYNVMSIPTLIVFRDGQPVQKVVGYMPKEELVKRFSEVLVG